MAGWGRTQLVCFFCLGSVKKEGETKNAEKNVKQKRSFWYKKVDHMEKPTKQLKTTPPTTRPCLLNSEMETDVEKSVAIGNP